jgi:hypothetical protein
MKTDPCMQRECVQACARVCANGCGCVNMKQLISKRSVCSSTCWPVARHRWVAHWQTIKSRRLVDPPWTSGRYRVSDERRLCVSARHLATDRVDKHVHVLAVCCSGVGVGGQHGRAPRCCNTSVGCRWPDDGAHPECKRAAPWPGPSVINAGWGGRD